MSSTEKKSLSRYAVWSLTAGFVIAVVTYLLSNLSFPISTENLTLKWAYQLTSSFRDTEKHVPDNMLFVNTSYDRELVDVTNEYGFPKGNVDITDRAKLIEFLQLLNETKDYKYVVMDLRFERGMTTPHDSLLWTLIAATPHLVVPFHSDMDQVTDLYSSKYAHADFSASIEEGDFTKYLVAGEPRGSMAYRVYSERNDKDYSSFCGFYFSEGRLMRRAMLINLDINPTTEFDSDGDKNIYNLGSDILSHPNEAKSLFSDKIIFIGDFWERDNHPTYKGSMSGTAIHANAVSDILAGRHLISWWTAIFIWILLSLIIFLIISPHPLRRFANLSAWLPAKIANSTKWIAARPIVNIVFAFLGYGTLMTVVFLLLFLLTGQIYEVIAISIILVIISVLAKNNPQ